MGGASLRDKKWDIFKESITKSIQNPTDINLEEIHEVCTGHFDTQNPYFMASTTIK